MYLSQGLHRAVQCHANRAATIFGAREFSYEQFAERVARLAGALQGLGMGPGERVAMLAQNSNRYMEYFFATWWGGGVVNPVNFRWSSQEIAFSLNDCDTKILLVDDQYQSHVDELRARCKSLDVVINAGEGPTRPGMQNYDELVRTATPAPDAHRSGSDLAAVMYTGGTTGFPKGVMLSHDNLATNALAAVAHGVAAGDGRALLIAPMFHIAATTLMLAQITAGGTCAIVPVFNPLATLEAIAKFRISHVQLVPTMIQLLVDHPEVDQFDLTSLQVMAYGGSVISEAVLQRAMKRFPNASFIQAYGMTELSPCATYLLASEHRNVTGEPALLRSAGRASFASEVRVVDEEDCEVARGVVGEVVVRSPTIMLGYWNQPDQTATALRGGWMHTGDGGYLDDKGYLYIVDRLKDMIVTGGENVYSAEVENALALHPSVAIGDVVGVPSDQWGEAVHAVVVLKSGFHATAEELISHTRRVIARYKCPRSIEFRDALPMTGAGKVQKNELRKSFWSNIDRAVH